MQDCVKFSNYLLKCPKPFGLFGPSAYVTFYISDGIFNQTET